jgi:hypothetical protein
MMSNDVYMLQKWPETHPAKVLAKETERAASALGRARFARTVSIFINRGIPLWE